MKNRQILCVLLVLCTLLTGTQASAQNTAVTDEGKCGENVSWTFYDSDGALFIVGTGKMEDFSKNSQPWHEYLEKIKYIVISNGITHIGKSSFEGCTNAGLIAKVPNSVVSIGNRAFAEMGIKSITLPESAVNLGNSLFEKCEQLVSVELPDTLIRIPQSMFSGCKSLERIKLPPSVQFIGSSAFYNCQKLEEITFPASLRELERCLDNCYGLKDIYFLGPYLKDWNGDIFSLNYRTVHCQPEYYEDYKSLLNYAQNASRSYDHDAVFLTSGSQKLTLDEYMITVSPSAPTVKLTPSIVETPVSYTIKWTSLDPSVATVDQDGTVSLAEKHGGTLVYAEATLSNGCKTLVSCLVQAQHNDKLVQMLPLTDVEADYPVSCNISSQSPSGLTAYYQPSKLVETDTSNKYYQEILRLTNSLTSECSTDTDKARAIQSWVSQNIKYGGMIGIGNSVDVVYSTYINRSAHCMGYSYLTGFMLTQASIPNAIITNFGHMWNIALLDGKWKMIDATNGKFCFEDNDPDYGAINYICFGQGDCCMMLTGYDGLVLAGVGNNVQERAGLTAITVPNYVTTIFGAAFSDCENLVSVTIPVCVRNIGPKAFQGCKSLTDVYYGGTRAQWNAVNIDTDGNIKLRTANIHCIDDDNSGVEIVDKPSDWALDSVERAIVMGILPESLMTEFSKNITRAEFCTLAVRMVEKIRGPIQGRVSFNDTNSEDVEKMAYLGVVNGVGDGNFNPNGLLTREQAATILVRLAKALDSPIPLTNFPSFNDKDSISSWAFIAVAQVNSSGIMIGVDDENFAPLRSYTREQSIVTLMRLCNFIA